MQKAIGLGKGGGGRRPCKRPSVVSVSARHVSRGLCTVTHSVFVAGPGVTEGKRQPNTGVFDIKLNAQYTASISDHYDLLARQQNVVFPADFTEQHAAFPLSDGATEQPVGMIFVLLTSN